MCSNSGLILAQHDLSARDWLWGPEAVEKELEAENPGLLLSLLSLAVMT